LWWIYGGKRIKRLQDLKGGKTIGITSLGANTDLITREVLRANGMDPQRDVVIQPVGLGGTRVAALVAGTIDAAILNPMESLTVKKQGLNELVFLGDYDLAIAQGGVATRESLLRDNRDLVRRFVRATLRAFLWFRANEPDAVLKMSKTFNLSKEEAAELYKTVAKNFTADGTISRELQQRIIAFQSSQLKLEKAISPDNVYDFSIVRAVHEEQKKTRP
jgi:NitT/TauT family transport system substrate-binding protein